MHSCWFRVHCRQTVSYSSVNNVEAAEVPYKGRSLGVNRDEPLWQHNVALGGSIRLYPAVPSFRCSLVPCPSHLTRIPSFRISLRNICRIAACQSIHSSASIFFASFFARAVSRAFSRAARSKAARFSSDPSRGASA